MAKLTYTDLQNEYLADIGLPGSTDSNILGVFNRSLMQGYDQILAELDNWQTQIQATGSTVANQQYYHYPASTKAVNDITVKIGSIAYPLRVVNSQLKWDYVNQLLIAVTVIPQFFFPRRDDFGIWPIPQ